MRVRSVFCALAITAVLTLLSASALAYSVSYDFTGADHGTTDFSLVGSAFWANDAGVPGGPPTRLRLTSNGGGQVGNAWLNAATANAGFAWTAEFTYQITFEVGGGADGLGFHLQENGTGANTFFGGQGLSNPRLSVGIDTFDNGGEGGYHLEVWFNGAQVGGNVDLNGLGSLVDDVWQVQMSYDGAGNLTVNVVDTNNSNQTGNQNYAVDLSALDNAIMGFSANTGGSAENHDIRTFSGTFLVPEPTTGLLLGLGLLGLARQGRRRA